VSPENLVGLVEMLLIKKITGKAAKEVLEEMFRTGKNAEEIVKEKGLETIQDKKEIEIIVDMIIKNNTRIVNDLEKNPNAIGALIGQVMKETKGKADPGLVNKLLRDKLL